MGLNCGIVGLPNVGKSTIFQVLTSAGAEIANYPFCTIEPNVGIVEVPDQRLSFLKSLYPTAKVIPAVVEIVDIAGIVKGASTGAGLGNKFLAHIREVDAIIHVVRCFKDDNIIHVDGDVSPLRDIETINSELALADLEAIEKRKFRTQKQARGRDKNAELELSLLEQLEKMLNTGKWLSNTIGKMFSEEQMAIIRTFQLLTAKPLIYLANISDISEKNIHVAEIEAYCQKEGFQFLSLCGKLEEELAGLSGEEKQAFLQELGIAESGIDRLIKLAYKTLGLITFLTAGDKEVRAWTIKNGSTAPQAAGVIHSDFERGFIRAETVAYDDLKNTGNYANAKTKGLIRSEGKEYIMKDGDVVIFRFNV